MSMANGVLSLVGEIAAVVAACLFIVFRGLHFLQYFQQEEYDQRRFVSWLGGSRAFDIRASLFILAGLILGFLGPPTLATFAPWLIGVGFLLGAMISRSAMRGAKKPLAMTARVRRIFAIYALLSLAGLAFAATSGETLGSAAAFVATLALAQLPPFILVIANLLLMPYERHVQAKFRREAEDKLARLKPTVIGIAGSYGKTSTKHILAHILGAHAPTLATPGSVNTVMGVTRIIRETLEERHKYFIAEMGAYGPGSITKLCKLAPPAHGIVTSIGKAHLERFGDIETVFRAKFELADAVLENGGSVAVNADQIPAELLSAYARAQPTGLVTTGSGEDADFKVSDVSLTTEGLRITVDWQGASEALSVPLYGRQQAGNVAVAAALALSIGLPMATVKAALASVGQIRHRLEVTKSKTGPIVIDDVYNSNPAGFRAGLELLDMLNREGGRRVVITPGMVELGPDHASEHLALGKEAARRADLVLLVTPDRVPTFAEGFRAAGEARAELMEFATQQAAEDWYKGNAQPLDTVLFENNLPDLYEAKVRF